MGGLNYLYYIVPYCTVTTKKENSHRLKSLQLEARFSTPEQKYLTACSWKRPN